MSTRPQKQISCKKHASVDAGAPMHGCLHWERLLWHPCHMASLPQPYAEG
jgi:hypothetical protein